MKDLEKHLLCWYYIYGFRHCGCFSNGLKCWVWCVVCLGTHSASLACLLIHTTTQSSNIITNTHGSNCPLAFLHTFHM